MQLLNSRLGAVSSVKRLIEALSAAEQRTSPHSLARSDFGTLIELYFPGSIRVLTEDGREKGGGTGNLTLIRSPDFPRLVPLSRSRLLIIRNIPLFLSLSLSRFLSLSTDQDPEPSNFNHEKLSGSAIFEQGTDEVQSAFKFAMLTHNQNVSARKFELQAYVDVINTADAFKLSRLTWPKFAIWQVKQYEHHLPAIVQSYANVSFNEVVFAFWRSTTAEGHRAKLSKSAPYRDTHNIPLSDWCQAINNTNCEKRHNLMTVCQDN
ncbi:hypothetical protein LSTR_LSTR012637 [Laodelphax striatellus]|uniref:Uncharacterized protein n=1 Tax=Laodelphax striatellus TaxID=195883 RepID=A0A482WRT6_LAOST|nr:hypothetical protein LSTR_LSTR012637 [Laodelphax striatellus]